MARDTADATPIEDIDQLTASLAAGCKPKDQWRIGTEHEKFGFYRDGNSPVPYEGPNGVRALLEGMETLLGWNPIYDGDKIIGRRLGGNIVGAQRPKPRQDLCPCRRAHHVDHRRFGLRVKAHAARPRPRNRASGPGIRPRNAV